MKIIVLSDTHMPKKSKTFPKPLVQAISTADLIIHAGDWQTVDVYYALLTYGQVHGVTGNVDSPELHELLPEKLVLSLEGYKIGVVHGHGQRLTTERRALEAFADVSVDCIIFGHSHIPVKKETGGILLFNPGSCTDKRRQPEYSFGIVTVNPTGITAEHIFFQK